MKIPLFLGTFLTPLSNTPRASSISLDLAVSGLLLACCCCILTTWLWLCRVPKEFCIDELMQDMTPDHQDAFYVVDLSVVMHKLNKWRELLPRVKPFYAVKCNNDEAICRMLATAGWSLIP